MALQKRQNNLFAAEDWKVVYQTFQKVSLTAYDFDTIREAMINHLRSTYPESFNDWIENDEFIFILDTISFLGQNLSFRMDLNTRENFIDTASRRDSVLRLANMLSYNPRRNYPGRGLVKINQVQTNEDVRDSNGKSLSGVPVKWNDPLNPDWYEQFILIMNACFITTNPFGSPIKKYTSNNVVTHLYQINSAPFTSPSEKFSANVNGSGMNFEVINPNINSLGLFEERHPEPQKSKHIIYRTDGNGFSSPDTGFFMYFKQGALKFEDYQFDLQVENRTLDINVNNINEIDVWVQEIDADGVVLDTWTKVPSTQNITYNSVSKQITKIYSVITKDNDQITIRFPDSLSGSIPRGSFRVWYRTSNGESYTIKTSDMQNKSISYTYNSPVGAKKVDMQFSLEYQVQNAQERETTEQIRSRAPQNYYTQNRLITGEDYNVGPLKQGNIVLKSKALNRTYSGHSRFIDINDPSGLYQNVDVFKDDGVLYYEGGYSQSTATLPSSLANETITLDYIEPLINNFSVKTLYQDRGTSTTYWNTNTQTENRSNKVKVTSNEVIFWLPNSNSIPKGSSGKFSVDVTSLVPYINSGTVLKLVDTTNNSNVLWTSILSYDSSSAEYTLSVPLNKSGWSVTEYYPTLRNNFNPNEIISIVNALSNYESFGLVYDLRDSRWRVVNVSNNQINRYITNTWEDFPITLSGDYSSIPVWKMNSTYNIGDYVNVGSELYRSLENRISGALFDSAEKTHWEFIGNGLTETYDENKSYVYNSVVAYHDGVFKVINLNGDNGKEPLDQNGTINPEWELVQNLLLPNFKLYNDGVQYQENNLVRLGTNIYSVRSSTKTLVNSSNASYNFDYTKWTKIYGSEQTIFDPLVLCNFNAKSWDFFSLSKNYIFYGNKIGFYFTTTEEIPDINSGIAQKDKIKILKSNSNPFNNGLGYINDVIMNVNERVYQIDGYIDPYRVKVAPQVDVYNNPLNPETLKDVIGDSSTETELFWKRNDDNTEEYLDLTNVRIEENEKNEYDSLVNFFILSEITDQEYGVRDEIYGPSGTIFTYFNSIEDEYEYYSINESRSTENSITLSSFLSAKSEQDFSQWLSINSLEVVNNVNVKNGRLGLSFQWKHYAPSEHRIDPSVSNIIDIYVLTTSYYNSVKKWATVNPSYPVPSAPTNNELRYTFNEVEKIKAISDAVIWHSAKFVPLFGEGSSSELKATFNVVRAPGSSVSDDEIRQRVISACNTFFEIDNWDFGESFFFTELSTYIHQQLINDIASVVIVPLDKTSKFGTLFEIKCEPDEIFISTASVDNVKIVDSLTANTIQIGF